MKKVHITVTQENTVVTINIEAPAACGKSTLAKLLEIELTSSHLTVENKDDTEGTLLTPQKVVRGLSALQNNTIIYITGYEGIANRVSKIINATGIENQYNRRYIKGILSPATKVVITTTQAICSRPSHKLDLYNTPLSAEIRSLYKEAIQKVPCGTNLDAELFCSYAIKTLVNEGKLIIPTEINEFEKLDNAKGNEEHVSTPNNTILGVSYSEESAYRLYELRMHLWQNACSKEMSKVSFNKFLKEGQEFIALGKLPTL